MFVDENTRVFIETKNSWVWAWGHDQIPLVDVDGAKKDGWRDVCDSLEERIVTGDDGRPVMTATRRPCTLFIPTLILTRLRAAEPNVCHYCQHSPVKIRGLQANEM